jgi:hypothetical protein
VRLERKEHVVTSEELFEKLVRRELEHAPAPRAEAVLEPKASSKSGKGKKA